MSNDIDSARSFEDVVAAAENLIARKTVQVKEEMATFAALLSLKDDPAESARYEYHFWLDQARAAGIKGDESKDGEVWDNGYWRGFPEPVGARMRCVDAFYELMEFLDPDRVDSTFTSFERARTIDQFLSILRSETAHVAPPPTKYRAWLKREKIKKRIEELQEKLKVTPIVREPGLQTSAQIGTGPTI